MEKNRSNSARARTGGSDRARPRAHAAVAVLLAALAAGCSTESGPEAHGAGVQSDASGGPISNGASGAPGTRLDELYAALDAGLPEAASTLLDQVGDSIGVEAPLLRARIALISGDSVGALKHIESAKRLDAAQSSDAGWAPDVRVLAAEVEIHVALDRLVGAREMLRDAYKSVGRTAELERARGVLLIRTPGGGGEGLAALQAALELDPALPFVGFPLAQAHHLAGREALAEQRAPDALVHAKEARSYDPLRLTYRELDAEASAANGDFGRAVELYRGLEAEGRDLGETLAVMHKNWGTQLLIEKKRDEALVQYCAARDLGFPLGKFAEGVLRDAANERVDEGVALLAAEDWSRASVLFRSALELAPDNVEAWNHLGVCLFRESDFYGAGEVWEEVLLIADRDGLELPDPVHLNLARAWRLAGEWERALRAVSDFLDSPGAETSPWAEETRSLLTQLESERLGAGAAGAGVDSGG